MPMPVASEETPIKSYHMYDICNLFVNNEIDLNTDYWRVNGQMVRNFDLSVDLLLTPDISFLS